MKECNIRKVCQESYLETAFDNVNMFVLLKTETNDYAKHMRKTNMNVENGDNLAGKWDVSGIFYSSALEKSH